MRKILSFFTLTLSLFVMAQPAWQPEICLVTVDSATSTFISVIWNKPVVTDIDSFYIYRADTSSGQFSKIAAVDYADTSVYDDISVNVNATWYSYLISAIDFNGNEGAKSDTANACLLDVVPNLASGFYTCKWNKYNNGINLPSFYRCMWDSTGNTGSLQQIGSNFSPTWSSWNHYGYSQANTSVYRLEVEVSNACNPSRGLVNTSRSNVKNVANPLTLSLESGADLVKLTRAFPNPVSDNLFLEWNAALGVQRIDMLDVAGKLVLSFIPTEKQLKTSLSLSETPEGVYLVRFSTAGGLLVRKIVKQ